MKTCTLFIRSTVLATALVLAGAAHAQGYSTDQPESPPPSGGSVPSGGASDRGSDYGTSETSRRGQYEGSRQSSSGQSSCEGSEYDQGGDMYDRCGNNGTGPRIKGRY